MRNKKLMLSIGLLALALGASTWAAVIIPIGRADLQISGLTINSPASIGCGQNTYSLTFTETNAGTVRSGTFGDLLTITWSLGGGATFFQCPILNRPNLGAGASRVVTLSATCYNGPCDCPPTSYTASHQMTIDFANQVAESNEGNNTSNSVVLPATCP